MRKLAPLFISAAIVTFAGTAAAHNDMTAAATDRTGSPTVSENTIKKPLSYSDKSNTAKGTNAKMKMEDSATVAATGSTDTTAQAPSGEGRKDLTEELNKEDKDKTAKKKVTHAKTEDKDKKKDTVAGTSTPANGSMGANGSAMPDAKPSPASDNPPLTATQAEKANSLTGKSAGR